MTRFPAGVTARPAPAAGRGASFRMLLLGILLLAAGCETLNPAPYDPTGDAAVVPPFTSFSSAASALRQLAIGYRTQRNALMQQKEAFDLPLIGLGVATVANGIFHGAQTTTLALGLGSAGIAGSSLYFAPQSRIAAYSAAQQALLCALGVADRMAAEDAIETAKGAPDTHSLKLQLTADIAVAASMLTSGTSPASSALLAARDAANKALTDLQAADALRTGGPGQLEAFANDTINAATAKVVGSAQNVSAALAALPKQGSTATPSPLAAGALTANALLQSRGSGIDAATVINALNDDVAAANVVAQRVNAAWSGFAKCAAS